MRNIEPLDPGDNWERFTTPNGRFMEWVMKKYPPPFLMRLILDLYYRRSFNFRNHTSGVSKHYDDIPTSFYELFLDKEYMFYSSGDFLKSTDTLEDAQINKANYLVELIDPKPGEKILELGPGWVSMLKRIYEKTGDKENLHGYMLSIEQKKSTDRKYGFNIEYSDYISTEYEQESFDKILSVEVLEHVRECELLQLSCKLANALKPEGKIVHQFFCQMEDLPPPRLRIAGFQIFPGSELASLKKHLDSFEQANLKVTHHSIHDYRPTLKTWFDRLVANKESAIELAGVRNYNKYQCYLAEAWRLFNDRDLILNRIVLERQQG
ncbi:class I SAM-dependent methyltransferase [Chloroflexota bacterium]